jgi:hypothetical protein
MGEGLKVATIVDDRSKSNLGTQGVAREGGRARTETASGNEERLHRVCRPAVVARRLLPTPLAPILTHMRLLSLRGAADCGGVLNATLCTIHCAAGPALLAWWGTRNPGAVAERWELAFLVLSGVLVALASRRAATPGLRLALWGCFGVFAMAGLLAEQWPWLQAVQYAASVGLIIAHLLNRRRAGC